MHMVAPRTGADEITIAEDQLEYKPLVVAVYQTPQGVPVLLTRWRLTEEERQLVAAGEDLYLSVLTFGQPLQPIGLQVGPEGWQVVAT
jgi:hypothetical protein